MIKCPNCNKSFHPTQSFVIWPSRFIQIVFTSPVLVVHRYQKYLSLRILDSRDIPRGYGYTGCPKCRGLILEGAP